MYKIYTIVDYADTCRDPSDIHIEEFGYTSDLEKAIQFAENYIKEHFFDKNTVLFECKDNSIRATDFGSWGKTIIIEPMKEL